MDSRGEMTAFLYTVKNASIENLNGDQGEGRIAGLAHQSSCIGMGFSTEAEDLPCKRRSRRSADCGWNQNHLEDLKLRTPPPEPLIQEVWERVKEFAFLTSSQIILLLPIQELHFNTHSSPSTEARQRRKKKKEQKQMKQITEKQHIKSIKSKVYSLIISTELTNLLVGKLELLKLEIKEGSLLPTLYK